MEKKLSSFDRTTFIIKWYSLRTADELPIIFVEDSFGQEDVFHPNCLHRDLIHGVSDHYVVDFEITQLFCVISIHLILNPLHKLLFFILLHVLLLP